MKKISLSKTQYMEAMRCPKMLWLRFHLPEAAEPYDTATLHLFKIGHRVERLAHQLFPGGVVIEKGVDESFQELILKTKNALMGSTGIIFEGTFASETSHCRADVVDKNESGSLNLGEIKMCTQVKSDHVMDTGFQCHCIEKSGNKIDQIHLIHINPDYYRKGELSPAGLFQCMNITAKAKMESSRIESMINNLISMVAFEQPPNAIPGSACKYPGKCQFYNYCHQSIHSGSIYELPFSAKLVPSLLKAGIYRLVDIPAGTKLSSRQHAQVLSAKRNFPVINRGELHNFLQGITHPVNYLDFEAIAPCIIPFDGCKAYGKIPFQYSLDVVKSNSSTPEHHEYLHETRSDPRKELIENLMMSIGSKGTILSWNMSYEKSVLTSLASTFPEHAPKILNEIIPRMVDLIVPFRNGIYADYRFQGSASIKRVLPIMAPNMKYENMAIKRGDDAAVFFEDFIDGDISEQQWHQLRPDLLEYCGLDTQGMIAIHEALRKACI
jgi:hypothetical protein